MSKTSSIYINTSDIDVNVYKQILESFLKNGWSFNKNGIVSFMVNGSYDWKGDSYDRLDVVLEMVMNSISNKMETTIDLRYLNTDIGVGVEYLGSDRIMFTLIGDVRMLSSIMIADFSWYLEQLAGVFKIIRLHRLECNYD